LKIAVVVVLLVLAVVAFWLWTPDKDRAVLEAKYLNAPTDMIEVAGVRLHVRDSGAKTENSNAPVVVLIHGFGGSLHSWEAWADGLASNHRVIRFDLPGSGLSSPDPTGDYSDARTMQLLIALMDQLGVGRADIVGHSIGGRMAWTFAATHPERVNKLVLVSPDGFASPGFVYGSTPEVPATVKLMRYALPKTLLKMSLAPLSRPHAGPRLARCPDFPHAANRVGRSAASAGAHSSADFVGVGRGRRHDPLRQFSRLPQDHRQRETGCVQRHRPSAARRSGHAIVEGGG
jgi:pimeloyl-ACP methyl ester carboxylesterase